MEAAFWGFVGTVVGALASVGTTIVSARNNAALQTSASALERAERERSFQRDTLIELQDTVHNLMRLVMRGHFEDEMAFHKTGNWGSLPQSDEVNEGTLLARRRLLILVERLADDTLRSELKQLNKSLTRVSLANSQNSAKASSEAASAQAEQVFEHIGEALRAQY